MKWVIRKMRNKLAYYVSALVNVQNHMELERKFLKHSSNKIHETLILGKHFTYDLPHKEVFNIFIEENVQLKHYCHILIYPKAKIIIGKNVFFNNYCSINCLESITIGDNTIFGEGVKLYDHNHSFKFTTKLAVSVAEHTTAPITIGNNCWIASNVTILKGVTIGDNVIIGANNLIYKSIPSNTVVKAKTDFLIETI